MCKDACLVQGEVWTVAHGCGAIRAVVLAARALLAVAVVAIAAAAVPPGALAASVSAQPISHAQPTAPPTSHTHPASHTNKVAPCPGANLRPARTNTAAVEAATLCLIDRERAAGHLPPLRANHQLQAVAVSQVTNMVKLDYFGDDRPTGATPMTLILDSGYALPAQRLSIAEDIGWGTLAEATPAQIVAGWMDSAPHREAILTREYKDAGVGTIAAAPRRLAQGRSGATYALELARR